MHEWQSDKVKAFFSKKKFLMNIKKRKKVKTWKNIGLREIQSINLKRNQLTLIFKKDVLGEQNQIIFGKLLSNICLKIPAVPY